MAAASIRRIVAVGICLIDLDQGVRDLARHRRRGRGDEANALPLVRRRAVNRPSAGSVPMRNGKTDRPSATASASDADARLRLDPTVIDAARTGWPHRPRNTMSKRYPSAHSGLRQVEIERRHEPLPCPLVRNRLKIGSCVNSGSFGKIHLRHEPRSEVQAEQRKMNVRRTPGVRMIAPRIRSGLDRDELITSVGVGQRPPGPGEIRVERRRMIVDRVRVTPRRVALPDFDQRCGIARPSSSTTWPDTMMRSPSGSPTMLGRQVVVRRADRQIAVDGRRQIPDRSSAAAAAASRGHA